MGFEKKLEEPKVEEQRDVKPEEINEKPKIDDFVDETLEEAQEKVEQAKEAVKEVDTYEFAESIATFAQPFLRLPEKAVVAYKNIAGGLAQLLGLNKFSTVDIAEKLPAPLRILLAVAVFGVPLFILKKFIPNDEAAKTIPIPEEALNKEQLEEYQKLIEQINGEENGK